MRVYGGEVETRREAKKKKEKKRMGLYSESRNLLQKVS